MRRKRLILAALVALGLAPGTFIRTIPPAPDYTSPVSIVPLAVTPVRSGPFTLVGAWHLSSRNDHFGGYSALLARPDGTLMAASDAGRVMILDRPDRPGGEQPRLGAFANYSHVDKYHADIESLTQDPATGRIWAGLEWANAIERFGPDLRWQERIRPRPMERWGENSGPEALTRLSDGRFLVVEERATGARAAHHNALLFRSDPTDGNWPMYFYLVGIDGYRPVDATPLADGSALVLFRRIAPGLPLRFITAIGHYNPQRAKRGQELWGKPLAFLEDIVPEDNYEGMAVTQEADGTRHLWLISDDNFASYQRTLLLKLRWDVGDPHAPDTHNKGRADHAARP